MVGCCYQIRSDPADWWGQHPSQKIATPGTVRCGCGAEPELVVVVGGAAVLGLQPGRVDRTGGPDDGVGGDSAPCIKPLPEPSLHFTVLSPSPTRQPNGVPTKPSPMAAPVSQPPVAARASTRFLPRRIGALPESAPASLRFSVGRRRRAARLGPRGCSPSPRILLTGICFV